MQKTVVARSVKLFVVFGLLLPLVIAFCFGAFLANNGARFILCMVSECERIPRTDEGLSLWLEQQPGVVAKSVRVFRKGRHLYVTFFFDRSFDGRPEFPDIDTKCRSLGYVSGPFRPCTTSVQFPPEAAHAERNEERK